MPDATVVELAAFVRALQARYLTLRLLSPYAWFRGARLEVKVTGDVVVLAITSSPGVAKRAGILARVATHLGGVQLETLVGRAAMASPTWRPRERPGQPAGDEGKT